MTGSVEHQCDRCGQYEALCPCNPPNGPGPAIAIWIAACTAVTGLTVLALWALPI